MKRFFLMFVAVAGSLGPAMGQIEWTSYENNPVITPGFDVESQVIYRPTVIKWQGEYHLWYGKFWQNTRWMAYAISDDGIDWGQEPADNAVLGPSATAGTFDEREATFGSVILDGDTLKMWYSGTGQTASGIGLAWSVNGYSWTKVPGPASDNSVLDPTSDGAGALYVTQPTVVKQDDMYHMWYIRITSAATALGYEGRLAYARSSDGRNWQVVSGGGTNGAVLDLGAEDEFDGLAIQWPSVLYNENEGRFELWYQALGSDPFLAIVTSVGCARSQDGVGWEKIPDNQSQAGECFRSVAQPSVLLDDGQYKMWYALSATGQNGDVVMYATSGQAGTPVEGDELPQQRARLDIYPNPTTSRAAIRFSAQGQGAYVLEARDMLGRIVSRVDLGARSVGVQQMIWQGLSSSGTGLPAGAYLLRVVNSSTGEPAASGIVNIVR